MSTIFQLSSNDSLSASDLLLIGDSANYDSRRVSIATLVSYLNTNLTFPTSSLARQSASPAATGFSVTILAGNSWLILTPLAGYATGTIVLPTGVDGQIVTVNCTQAVTTLTVSGSTSTVVGAPTALTANAFFTMKFDQINDTWYRIG